MCTFSIALDDKIVDSARKTFADDKSFTAWMEEQITLLLTSHVLLPKNNIERTSHKHDALMGIIADAPELDYKRVHLKEKYGL